jgi:copper chaperone
MNSKQLQLDISGMSCGSCVAHVRSALERLPGVRVEDVQVGSADVALAPTVEEGTIRQAIADAGYTLTSIQPAGAQSHDAVRAVPGAPGGCCCGGGHDHLSSSPELQRRSTSGRHRY